MAGHNNMELEDMVPIELGQRLRISHVGAYTGTYMEDGSNDGGSTLCSRQMPYDCCYIRCIAYGILLFVARDAYLCGNGWGGLF